MPLILQPRHLLQLPDSDRSDRQWWRRKRTSMTPLAAGFNWRKVKQLPMTSWGRIIGSALLPLVVISCHVSRAPKSDENSKQELLALENRWLQAEDDPAVLEGILAADFLHVVPNEIITKDQQLKFLREHPASEQHPDKHFEDLHVRVYGDAGIVNGVVIAKTEHGERKTLFTDVFAYRDGKWQAVSAQELPVNTDSIK